jgi:hypothetical protein
MNNASNPINAHAKIKALHRAIEILGLRKLTEEEATVLVLAADKRANKTQTQLMLFEFIIILVGGTLAFSVLGFPLLKALGFIVISYLAYDVWRFVDKKRKGLADLVAQELLTDAIQLCDTKRGASVSDLYPKVK